MRHLGCRKEHLPSPMVKKRWDSKDTEIAKEHYGRNEQVSLGTESKGERGRVTRW